MTTSKTQIGALTSTRAIAAIMVVIHHYGSGLYPFNLSPNMFRSGNLAVSYFFVLSGFVLYVAHVNKPLNYFNYMRRRAARIFPLYYLALLLTVGAFYLEPPLPGNMKEQVIYGALMIQSYIPGYAISLNSPGWSISVEMFFYLIFPLLLLLEQRSMKVFAALCLVLFVITQYLHLHHFVDRYHLPDNIIDPLFFSPPIHISQFMIGMIGGWIYKKVEDREAIKWYIPVLCFTFTMLLIAFRPETISYHVGLIAPVFTLLIICVARSKSPVLNLPGFVFLGEISYGIYILQYPVFRYMDMLNKKYFQLGGGSYFYVACGVLIIVSAILYYTLERPLRKWIAGR